MFPIQPPTEGSEDAEASAQTSSERRLAASRSTWVSIAVNLLLSTAQVSAGVLTKSQGLIADGIHSLSDLVADVIVLVANHQSHQQADQQHPYGHHRFETAASLVLGFILVAVGVGMIWKSVQSIQDPHAIAVVSPTALWAAGGGLIAKEVLFRYLLSVAKRVKSGLLVANAWHARSDAASSLVVGLGILGNLAGYPMLDPIAALIVGLMIVKLGSGFGWEALHDLMDRAANEAEVAAITQTLESTMGVREVHDLRTRRMGDLIHVDVHLSVDAGLTVEAGHDIALEAKRRTLERHRVLNVMTHIDPWKGPAIKER